MADTADSGAANAADALRHDVDGLKHRIGLLVEEQVIVAEVRTGEVPVEVLRLDIERESIGDEWVDSLCNGLCFLRGQIGHRRQLRRGRGRLFLGFCFFLSWYNLFSLWGFCKVVFLHCYFSFRPFPSEGS